MRGNAVGRRSVKSRPPPTTSSSTRDQNHKALSSEDIALYARSAGPLARLRVPDVGYTPNNGLVGSLVTIEVAVEGI